MWHIDVLINRALVYGTLTGTLAVPYIGLIIVLQYLLRDFIGGNQLAIVGYTLVQGRRNNAGVHTTAKSLFQEPSDSRVISTRLY